MLGPAVLLPLFLWITAVHAFFPWYPASVCAEDSSVCQTQDGSSSKARAVAPAGRVSYKLGRRLPTDKPNDEPLAARVARTAARLARKHAASPVKRSNDFSVMTAETPSATNAVGIDQDGTDFSYFVQAKFGSASTAMYMLLDTGAGTTWVMGTDCSSTACGMHNSFGSSDSDTFTSSSSSFSIAYGSGTVAGKLASDTVAIADLSMTMTFGVANTTSDDFTHFPFDGILGLSTSKGSTDNFWATVKAAKLLSANVFGVSLARAADSDTNAGEIMFGAADTDKYTGDISYTAVASSGNWAIDLDDMGYDGDTAGITGRVAYIDTGTTYMFGPPDDVALLHAQIPGASSTDNVTYTVPCTSDQDITVVFSGVSYGISSKDWLSSSDSSDNCTSNIYGHEVVDNAWLMGDLFIKNVYAVFDVDKSRIGFATRAATSSSSSASSTSSSTSSGTKNGSLSSGSATASVTAEASAAIGMGGSGSSSSATALAAESATASAATAGATQTASSSADQLEGNKYVSVVCIVAAIAMAV